MADETPKKPSVMSQVNDADMAIYTGKNWAAYEPTWRALKYNEKPTKIFDFKNINWLALALAPIWFLYRKMYLSMLGYLVVVFCIDYLLETLGVKNIPGIVYAIAAQQASRALYLYINAKKIIAIRKLGETDEVTNQKLAHAGGVSNIAAWIGTVILAAYLGYAIYISQQSTIIGTPQLIDQSGAGPENYFPANLTPKGEAPPSIGDTEVILDQHNESSYTTPNTLPNTGPNTAPQAAPVPEAPINGAIDGNQPNVEKK